MGWIRTGNSRRGSIGMPRLGFGIQRIVKTYHKSILWTRGKTADDDEGSAERDKAEISIEARKRQVCQRARKQVLEKLTRTENPSQRPEENR
jgi:hypothetical protein